MLTVRLLADKTAEPELVRSDDGALREVWPPLIVSDADGVYRRALRLAVEALREDGTGDLPTTWVIRGLAGGWLTLEGARPVTRPGGPPDNPWLGAIYGVDDEGEPIRRNHEFLHADAIVLHTIDGPVRYRVVRQPDKYVDPEQVSGADDDTPVSEHDYAMGRTIVASFYTVVREG